MRLPSGRRILVLGWLLLLIPSHLHQARLGNTAHPAEGQSVIALQAVDDGRRLASEIELSYDLWPADGRGSGELPVLLLHGSPAGARMTFDHFLPYFLGPRPVLAPDLPGFGGSSMALPDYSMQAHADYALQLLDRLGIERAHVVGYSQGGGVAIELADRAPERVASLTLMAGIGVQELELLGDFALNHALYALQLAAFQGLDWLLPHFGRLDRFPLNLGYARNYFDSDQRPLRGMLSRWDGPSLILHGAEDHQVPLAAALEHHRILPQSELQVLPVGHGMSFDPAEAAIAAPALNEWLARVEAGGAITRGEASRDRLAAAALPVPPGLGLRAEGRMLAVIMLLLALATLVSEDLTSVSAGLMVARGALGLGPALAACFLGILGGDLLLYASGRLLGTRVLKRAPFRWLVSREDLDRGRDWFAHRGPAAILGSRFVPGLRFPTYVAAGVLQAPFWRVLTWFAIAAGIWVPLLLGSAVLVGGPVLSLLERYQRWAFPILLAGLVGLLVTGNLLLPALTWRGRRRLIGRWRRLTRWEYWPMWRFYPPIVAYVLWLGLRHRSLTLFTAANPAIPGGGFIGESKQGILSALEASGAPVPPFVHLPARLPLAQRLAEIETLRARHGLDYPIVLKPDAGQRGQGVTIARDAATLRARLEEARVDMIAQAFAPGIELGIFYYRLPGARRGRIFSVTEKRFPQVVGDGRTTLGDLILRHERAVCMAPQLERRHAARLWEVLPAGEAFPLVEIGTHSRGAEFRDGAHLSSPALEDRIEAISQAYEGFYFGRYDIRAATLERLQAGDLAIVELNGVTAEATHIYDRSSSLLDAWRCLGEQWRLAFAIGAANRARGARVTGLRALLLHLMAFESAD